MPAVPSSGSRGPSSLLSTLESFPASRDAIRPTLKSLLGFAGWNLFFGLRAGVDNSAHIGGLLAGLCLGSVFSRYLNADEDHRSGVRNFIAIGGAVLLLIAVLALRHEYKYPAHAAVSPQQYFDAIDKANSALAKEDFNAAIPELQKVVAVNPRSAEAHYLLGSAYLGAHQPDAALASFQRALQIKPHYTDAESGISMARSEKQKIQDAQDASRNLLK